MSILDRLLGDEPTDDESCCDVQIEEIDSDETEGDAPDEGVDRTQN